ncbi:MAG: ribonuclease H-like domain-containing protein [Bryobacterales bacterium]|nr:ribonuclease H-like domain-containing protein [Bryobacterales bacterium]
MDLQEQLAELRRRMAQASERAEAQVVQMQDEARARRAAAVAQLTQLTQGEEVRTAKGIHLEAQRLWDACAHHGTVDIGSLIELPADLFHAVSAGEAKPAPPAEWAFLDTETTGLAGGSGTCAFLIGVGRITPEGFRLRQFFLRDFGEEPSVLEALTAELSTARTLVTYNGRAFDIPLLETRYRMNRARPPFASLDHVDLLYGARRMWRLRLENCRLQQLEREIIGFEREGDIPGDQIPTAYFDFLRGQGAAWLAQVFEHNALDIVTLACVAAVLPQRFHEPASNKLDHPEEMVSMGRWLQQSARVEEALALFREAAARGLRDELMSRTLWDVSLIERRQKHWDAAVAVWSELASFANPHQALALIELSKHYEHREKNFEMALEWATQALGIEATEETRKRHTRLLRLAGGPKPRRLL